MNLLRKKKAPEPEFPAFSLEEYEPVVRSSICTGERVACMRDRESGRLREVMLIRTGEDLDAFCKAYGLKPEQVKTVY
ncbi:MAG: aspartate dehydrogenase [Oscillospiraceae bacterium]|nr:aspartate dehydrogenase [Oscillospiraceae bacterium]